jgi:hypothetical protein
MVALLKQSDGFEMIVTFFLLNIYFNIPFTNLIIAGVSNVNCRSDRETF